MDLKSEDFLKKMVTAGSFGYSAEKIINVFDVEDRDEFIAAFEDKQHPVFLNYRKGMDKADFTIDIALYKKSKDGDVEAIHQLALRRSLNNQEGLDDFHLKQHLRNA